MNAPKTHTITYFKPSGKYYCEDTGVVWPTDKPDHSGFNPLHTFQRIRDMYAVCMDAPHGFPQFSKPQEAE